MAAAATTAALLLRRRTPWRLLQIPTSVASLSQCPADRRVWPRQQHQQPGSSSSSSSSYNSREEVDEEVAEPEQGRPSLFNLWVNDPDYRKWKDKEALILGDVEPIIFIAKDILHSSRYKDGEQLSDEDKKIVVEKILAYHPHSEDKIGCGLYSIMVDRHPEFRHSRCLFVVRKDGGWIDFSYQKCLRAYIRQKYPSEAERFIKEHFKRT